MRNAMSCRFAVSVKCTSNLYVHSFLVAGPPTMPSWSLRADRFHRGIAIVMANPNDIPAGRALPDIAQAGTQYVSFLGLLGGEGRICRQIIDELLVGLAL